jgi:hypothetical protein
MSDVSVTETGMDSDDYELERRLDHDAEREPYSARPRPALSPYGTVRQRFERPVPPRKERP